MKQIKKIIEELLAMRYGSGSVFQPPADITYLVEHTQDERIESSYGICQAGGIGTKTQKLVKAC